MILLSFFLFLIIKGILTDENATNPNRGIQLWRVQGYLDENVLKEFNTRAHFTEQIWKRDDKTIDFLMNENEREYFFPFLDEHNVTYKMLMQNVSGKLDEETVNKFPTRRKGVSGDSFTWTEYPSLVDINRYLDKMAATYPDHCKVTTIGTTLQHRPIKMLKITTGIAGHPAILVDGGIHGKEWTSVISTLYFIDSIVRNYTKQPAYVTRRDWHIIPVLNPDGYVYSQTKDRKWTKNRHRFSGNCFGVDLNANFDINWGKTESSLMPCSADHCGTSPFSEEETKAFRTLVDITHYHGYISIHSAGTKVLYPKESELYDLDTHQQTTKQIGQAMGKIANYHFTNGNSHLLDLPDSFGMAIDWMYSVRQITHSYVIQTRGPIGLDLLQPAGILTALKEVRAGLLRFAELLK